MKEGEESRTPKFLTWITGRLELPFTERRRIRPELPFTEGESNSGVERRTGVWTGNVRLALTVDTER